MVEVIESVNLGGVVGTLLSFGCRMGLLDHMVVVGGLPIGQGCEVGCR